LLLYNYRLLHKICLTVDKFVRLYSVFQLFLLIFVLFSTEYSVSNLFRTALCNIFIMLYIFSNSKHFKTFTILYVLLLNSLLSPVVAWHQRVGNLMKYKWSVLRQKFIYYGQFSGPLSLLLRKHKRTSREAPVSVAGIQQTNEYTLSKLQRLRVIIIDGRLFRIYVDIQVF
jgi:hypothetical protein